jgi:glycine betaine/proline transport system substrate-binding protein
MSKRLGALLAAATVAIALVVAGAAFGKSGAADCGDVTINENAWAGSTANVYVAKYVLEKNLGCDVEVTKIAEIPVFQALADGKVDAVLEDWQHVDQYKQFISKQKSVVFAGKLGVVGHIGWYIPQYLLKQYPGFSSWKGLKGKESVFKSAESGSQGMFLGGDPSYVQKDKELIELLDLDFKHVTVGAEPAEVARFTQLIKQRKPVIFYWWTPQYLNSSLNLVEVKLPPRPKGCQDDASAGGDIKKYRCAYAADPLQKLLSKEFVQSGSPAVKMLRKFKWSNADQNLVAKWIAGDKMQPEKAAEKWVKANAAKVNAWLK